MKNLPTDFLRSFVTVAQCGSYTQCAEQLGRTQPAISLQIRRLEEIVGEKLFARHGNQLSLTAAGRSLHGYGVKMLQLNDEAIAEFDNPQISGRVRVGIPSEFAVVLLPKIIRRFTVAYPKVALEVHCELSKDLLSDEQKNRFDLILALQEWPNPSQPGYIKTERLVWAGSARHSTESRQPLPLICAPAPCIYRKRALQALENCGVAAQVVYTIADLTGIQSAVDEGIGLTVLTSSTVPENLSILDSNDNLPELGEIGVSIFMPRQNQSKAVALLAEAIANNLT
ncbi:LysR family transcriptional regulator [Pseudomaricurvus alkylphenolicus]|jgi:DNA-binding transcriptional LysR family regulator|uniref:LysR substrate-binding domain-containing protein n=1 Tax=Pseudomaricurvus alkylphenolicus TaxID=1306991 RepID=UPI001423E0C2|nr:LysR substrate-binding domain-containing protein [Pseudomaricurvus alkylphenolicus]NIB39045.1 LysR family transcriptional regulator [Pseudomaricurvus alkylphenolicus]